MSTANSPATTTASRGDERRSWDDIRDDYGLTPDLMADDDEEMLLIKQAVSHLPEYDRRIIVLYAELGNLRALARHLGVSRSTIHNRVRRIQAAIRADVERLRTLAGAAHNLSER